MPTPRESPVQCSPLTDRAEWMRLAVQHRRDPSKPQCFREILDAYPEGSADQGGCFERDVCHRDSLLAVIAIHGGGIEPGTCDLARAIAGDRFSHYIFRSHLPHDDDRLWLTSSKFDDPLLLQTVTQVQSVLSLHGCCDPFTGRRDKIAFVGGLDQVWRDRTISALRAVGIDARVDTLFRGEHPRNPCNLGRSGMGVQIELTRSLLEEILAELRGLGRKEVEETGVHPIIEALRGVAEGMAV